MPPSPCPLCQKFVLRVLIRKFYYFKGQHFDLVQCKGCHLIRVEPIPTDEIIQGMYDDGYFHEDWISGRCRGTYPEIFAKRLEEYREVMQAIEQKVDPENNVLLEIGSAGGGFLDFAKRRGWTVEGLEISSWGVRHAQEYYGIKAHQGDLIHSDLPERRYQVVFMGDVFEHFSDPAQALQKLNHTLKEGGYLVLLLPMYLSSWCFNFFRLCAPLIRLVKISKECRVLIRLEPKAETFNPPYHIFEYSAKTMGELLEKSGFQPLEIKGVLPIPEFLKRTPERESLPSKAMRNLILLFYKAAKFGAENFNLPLVRARVIARKERKA